MAVDKLLLRRTHTGMISMRAH
eukprot:COSAG06_NODE_29096_length_562_cov_2.140696_1_plen_21_part_10